MAKIIQIWKENFEEAIIRIKKSLESFDLVAMDTEFPGTVTRSLFELGRSHDYYFQTLRLNVDSLQLIQLGISFANEKNGLVGIKDCLQFNFDFNLSKNMFAQDSIDLLLRSGVDFECHKKKGISVEIFTNMLIESGLIFNEKIYWISFHSGYDFGYLIKILTKKSLPQDMLSFLKLTQFYFPNFYDVKYLNLFSGNFVGGLNKLAGKLQVERIGQMHQAGSDSILTLSVFEKLKRLYFDDVIEKKCKGVLFGLNDIQTENCMSENDYLVDDISNFINN
jgi:CCR4-NOT transcription complex subunit 7/8